MKILQNKAINKTVALELADKNQNLINQSYLIAQLDNEICNQIDSYIYINISRRQAIKSRNAYD